MTDHVSRVRHDYHAKRQSGTRPASRITYFVIHDSEAPNPTGAAEGVGAFFQSGSAQGSTHYGVDTNSTQQYLGDLVIPWGAPPINTSGLHVECAGVARLDRSSWLTQYGPMFARLGWLAASRCKRYGIPIRLLHANDLVRIGTDPAQGRGGITTHAAISAAFHKSTHTDPGPGFPIDLVMIHAKRYASGPIRSRVSRPVLHLGCTGRAVDYLAGRLTAYHMKPGVVQHRFTKATEDAVKTFQRNHHLAVDGIVGQHTWKVIG